MLFSSNLFLFLFLPAVLGGYYLLGKRLRNTFLLLVSLIFYAWGTGKFVVMMVASALFNYVTALVLERLQEPLFRKLTLTVSVVLNLSLLFVYKYLDFFITNINLLGFDLPLQHITLPLGISFFTFQAMSYSLDVYMGSAKVQKNPLNVILYVSFFPQLVAGPIVRYQTIADQIQHRQETFDDFSEGVRRFIIGFAKKVILSNNMALVSDAVFSNPDRSIIYAWMGAIAYTFQIFFDFSGYSDMAIGLGKMFGFHFLENFDYPYMSSSISEFWRRWHISLGQWFRDYVYFPLGGSRVKTKSRLVFNLFVVWSLTGVWHGASWNFVVWGLMYFFLLAFEKLTGIPEKLRFSWSKGIYRLFTLLCVIMGWVFFRTQTITDGLQFIQGMFCLSANGFTDDAAVRTIQQYGLFFLGALLCSTPVFSTVKMQISRRGKLAGRVVEFISVPVYCFLLLWSISYIMMGSHNPFIYFNF